jgi:prepilin-type N-terminal cleavage/methylation domain-containing protein
LFKINYSRGLTLIELLISLTIVGILIMAAVPTFISMYQEYRLGTNIQNVYYVLQYAKSAAIKNNQTIYVNFNNGTAWCYGMKANSTCDCTQANNCTLGTYSAPTTQDISLSTTGLNNNTLQFDGTHGSASTSTITFTLGSNTISVSIGALGNMRICSNQISGYPTCP